MAHASRRLTEAHNLFDPLTQQLLLQEAQRKEKLQRLDGLTAGLAAESSVRGPGQRHDAARISGVALGDTPVAWGALHRASELCE